MFNRRNLFKSTVLGATAYSLISNNDAQAQHHHHVELPQKTIDASKEPKRVRKSFYQLDDEEVRNLCRAIGYMRNEFPLNHPLHWDNYARVHALHCTEYNEDHPQVHWSWNFLPWHRGYLYFLERILANILTTHFKIDGSKFALPYWNWSLHREIPNTKTRKDLNIPSPFFGYDILQENMVTPDNLGFDNSALFEGNRGPSIAKPQMDPNNELTQDSKDHVNEALYYTSSEYIGHILAAPFDQFGGKPTISRETGQGLLEQGPHNDGHDWIGTRIGKNRTMGTLRNAAADPMFYMHHCNIDRIWSLYTNPQPDPKGPWGKTKYNFLDVDGSVITWSIQDIIEKTTNVTYDHESVPVVIKRQLSTQIPFRVNVNTMISDKPVEVFVNNLLSGEPVLVDILTGVIKDVNKYRINIFAKNKSSGEKEQLVGAIKWLDGEHRKHHRDEMTHTFSIMMSRLPKNTDTLILVPPKNGSLPIQIKSLVIRKL